MEALKRTGYTLLAPLVAIVIAVAATSIVIGISGSQTGIGRFWQVMLSAPQDWIYINIINHAGALYLSAIAAAIGFRMGLFNIGVEGQYRLAGYTAAVFAGAALLPGPLNIVVSLLIAIAVGSVWAGIAAVLRVTRGVSEVIGTLMLNAIAPIVVTYFLNKYGQNLGSETRTKPIQGSSTIWGWAPLGESNGEIWTLGLLAVLAGIGFWILLNRTRLGFDLRASGMSPTAAVASGINEKKMVLIAMLLSGAVAGLIWMPEYFGSAHSYGSTFSAGLGFTGIAVALLGRNEPVGMAFGALLFSWLESQSNVLQVRTDVASDIVQITEGVAVLAVVIAYELVRNYRTRLEQRTVASAAPAAEGAAA